MHDIDRHGIGRVQPVRPLTSFRSHTSWSLARLLSLVAQVMEMAVKQIDPHSSKKLHLSFDMDVVDLPTSQVLRLYLSTPLRDLPLRPFRIGSNCARYPRWFADVGADKSHQGRRHTRIFRDCFAQWV